MFKCLVKTFKFSITFVKSMPKVQLKSELYYLGTLGSAATNKINLYINCSAQGAKVTATQSTVTGVFLPKTLP
jgi:hypothetical protein